LRGSARANNFPKGAFPWLTVKATSKENSILVQLPPDPAVVKQFTAFFYKATQVKNQGQDVIFFASYSRKSNKRLDFYSNRIINATDIRPVALYS